MIYRPGDRHHTAGTWRNPAWRQSAAGAGAGHDAFYKVFRSAFWGAY